jgi:hypothetical protein
VLSPPLLDFLQLDSVLRERLLKEVDGWWTCQSGALRKPPQETQKKTEDAHRKTSKISSSLLSFY